MTCRLPGIFLLPSPLRQPALDDVQHLTGVPLHEDDPDASAATRLGAWAASWRNLDTTRIDFIVQTSVEQKLVHTPTLVVWAQAARSLDYTRLLDDPAAQLLPALVPRSLLATA